MIAVSGRESSSLLLGTVMLDHVGSPLGDVVPIQGTEMSHLDVPFFEPASFKSQERNTVLLSSVQLGAAWHGESDHQPPENPHC